MIIHITRFASALPDDRIGELFSARLGEYQDVQGLLEKYYLRFDNGQHGGVYVWDSRSSLEAFREGELSRSICDVYRVRESTIDVADVLLTLRPRGDLTATWQTG